MDFYNIAFAWIGEHRFHDFLVSLRVQAAPTVIDRSEPHLVGTVIIQKTPVPIVPVPVPDEGIHDKHIPKPFQKAVTVYKGLFVNRLEDVYKLCPVSLSFRINHAVFEGGEIVQRDAWFRKVTAGDNDFLLSLYRIDPHQGFLNRDADALINLAAQVLRKTAVAVTHAFIQLRLWRELEHILFTLVNHGDFVPVCASISLFSLFQVCKVYDVHTVTPFPVLNIFPADTMPVPD